MSKFYWLKLKKDFFKRHDLLNLRSLENGLAFEAIFIHLMTEAIDHEGYLRYSDKKAYTARTLAPLASTDEKTMKDALEAFEDLELIEIDKDGTIYVPLSVENMGSDTSWAEKKRQYREKLKTEEGQTEDKSRTNRGQKEDMSDKSIENRDKSIEIREKKKDERDKSLSSKKREIPTKNDVISFAHAQKIDKVIDADQFWSFYEGQEWKIEGEPIRDWKSLLMKWANNVKNRKNVTAFMDHDYTEEEMKSMKHDTLAELKALRKGKIMENDYDFSEEGIQKSLDESQKEIDDLLKE